MGYQNALIVADGDYVMLQGDSPISGNTPNGIAADIVRIEDGRLAEHCDVIPDEATREESNSAPPMFKAEFGS